MALESVAASSPSKTAAAVQEPRGTSVSAGCSGASNQTPSSVLRAVVPPASTASCTFGWTPSATLSRKGRASRSEEHTSELQSRQYLVCRLLLEKKNHNHPPVRHLLGYRKSNR